ncbi:6-phosphofructo-2-kinase [Acrasis kona]|uniref:6-phosphofructo-2-kinase n=1 Tax=Acrasis kona TaxID=1008807 RepID=A0AAW2ZPF1_9EUKA
MINCVSVDEDLDKVESDAEEDEVFKTDPTISHPQVSSNFSFVVVMVGLPARGKSYIARQISKYMNWLGVQTEVFNAGEYRRKILGPGQKYEFWDTNHKENYSMRKKISYTALADLIQWLQEHKSQQKCAIFDATNSTRARRSTILKKLGRANIPKHRVIFVESICNDPKILNRNIMDIKIKSYDYQEATSEEAKEDFLSRIKTYEEVYQTIEDRFDSEMSYIKMVEVGKKFVMNKIGGYIPGRITSLLMNSHITPRTILLSRHGESEDNTKGLLGGDSQLSPRGRAYAKVLSEFITEQHELRRNYDYLSFNNITVWTSTMKRTMMTSSQIPYDKLQWRQLDEIDAGICEGMTYAQVEESMPKEFAARQADKFGYPRGESYHDMIYRIEPTLMELERQREPVLIIGHQAVNRVIYAYLMGKKPIDCVEIPIPLHTVMEILPNAYGATEKRYDLNDRVDKELIKMLERGEIDHIPKQSH